MKKLQSIQEIEKVYDTGDNPVLVQCSDLEYYVCKHNRGRKPCKSLFAEYIAYHLMKALKIKLPNFKFIKIQTKHVKPAPNCQPLFYKDLTCFGTNYLGNSLEWSAFPLSNKDIKRIKNPEDLFTIAWCDIWLANEDRNWNNYNLLLNPEDSGWHIVPIDHGACLNSLSFKKGRGLYLINNSESIICTDQYKLIAKKHFNNLNDADQLARKLYICTQEIDQYFDEIVENIPESWGVPRDYIDQLKMNLFASDWLKNTKTQFLTLTKESLKLK